MRELGLDDLAAYERRLSQSELELQELIEEVVVAESWFFRDERPFQWFRDYVRQRWLNDPSRPPLRVLSLPCAGGEEPYSIAMTLLDLGLPARRFRIDAVDVSARRLAIARRGVYSANAFRGPDLELPGALLSRASPGLRARPRGPGDGPVHPGQRPRSPAARGIAPVRRALLPQSLDLPWCLGPRGRAGGDRPAAGARRCALHRPRRPARLGRRGGEIHGGRRPGLLCLSAGQLAASARV